MSDLMTSAAIAFDSIAAKYDAVFSESRIGMAQRRAVWRRLAKTFRPGDRILELNCGTGEDARFLASFGASVVAFDGSASMVERARIKCVGLEPRVRIDQLANEQIGALPSSRKFDGVFSNFAGLNCVRDLRSFATALARLTRPSARVVICVYGKYCLWEILWYLCNGDVRKASRRFRPTSQARIGGHHFEVFYPSMRQWAVDLAPHFEICSIEAIGLFVPPSYAESYALRFNGLLRKAEALDRALSHLPVLRTVGDHTLLAFRRVES